MPAENIQPPQNTNPKTIAFYERKLTKYQMLLITKRQEFQVLDEEYKKIQKKLQEKYQSKNSNMFSENVTTSEDLTVCSKRLGLLYEIPKLEERRDYYRDQLMQSAPPQSNIVAFKPAKTA